MPNSPDFDLLSPITLQYDGRAPVSSRERADSADYDNYFRIRRADRPEAWAKAVRQVTGEVLEDLPATSLDESTQRELLTGISALLLAASQWQEDTDDSRYADPNALPKTEAVVSVSRWKIGHHLFHLLLSLMNTHSDEVIGSMRAADWEQANPAITKLALLLDSATATMHYASDFPKGQYEGIIRPSMEPPWMPTGFSGVFNQEHRFFENNLKTIKQVRRSPDQPLETRAALKQLWRAQSKNRRDHRTICEKFVPGGESLLQQHFNKTDERISDLCPSPSSNTGT